MTRRLVVDVRPDGSAHEPVRLVAGGPERYEALAAELPVLLDALRGSVPLTRAPRRPLPKAEGVYLLTEGGVPTYVGQTRNLRRRIAQHGGLTSRENQASFAFGLARAEAAALRIDIARPRRALAADPAFAEVFHVARARVAQMEVRFVAVSDPAVRTVFEVYAAVALGTNNVFETH